MTIVVRMTALFCLSSKHTSLYQPDQQRTPKYTGQCSDNIESHGLGEDTYPDLEYLRLLPFPGLLILLFEKSPLIMLQASTYLQKQR